MCSSYQSLIVGVALAGAGLGCAGDMTGPPPLDPANLYFRLALNHHAITLALTPPYDTIQLVATPRSATGTLITDTGTTTYQVTSGDLGGGPDTNVTISATGMLKAIAPVAGLLVIARHTIGHLTYADTAVVNVNDISPVPHFNALALHFEPGDTARGTSWSLFPVPNSLFGFGTPGVVGIAHDQRGDSIPNVAVVYTFSVPATPQFALNGTTIELFNFSTPGHVRIAGEATVYGRLIVDTVTYTVGWPLVGVVGIFPRIPAGSHTPIGYFQPQDDTVAAGATIVVVNNLNGLPVDVVFDDPTAARSVDSASINESPWFTGVYRLPNEAGGNIPAWRTVLDTVAVNGDGTAHTIIEVRARRFPVAGTYRYHSALYGSTGVLHVLPAFQVP